MGRPTDFSQELADKILERIADGESLRAICREDCFPAKTTVFRWLQADEVFRDLYEKAREAQADSLADEILDIADTPQIGEKTKKTPDGKVETTTGDMIEHRRLRVEARKWIAAKLKPRKYGDSSKLEVTGKDEGPIQYEDTTRERNLQSIEQLSARLAGAAPGTPAAPTAGSTDAEPDTGSST